MTYQNNTWDSFQYVEQAKISEVTGAAYSSLSKWKKTRKDRVRLLELSVLLPIFTEKQRNELITQDLPGLIKNVCGPNMNEKIIFSLLGEKRRTIFSWWNSQGLKKKKCLLRQLEGVFSILAILQHHKMKDFELASEEEKEASKKVVMDSEIVNKVAFTAFNLF